VFGVLIAARRKTHSFSSGECEFLRQGASTSHWLLTAEGDIPPYVDHVLSKPPKLRVLREALARCLDR
jgi:hypothetical protein